MIKLSTSLFEFINDLKGNNNREWFAENKPTYQKEHEQFVLFADAILSELQKSDDIETPSGKKSVFRIYRDIRFSKDKTPYKTHFSGSFKRATKLRRGGYYYHIEPGNSFIAGGFWGPNSADILRIRKEIAADASELKEIISTPTFKKTFGELKGDRLKSAPRGFDKTHPEIELLQLKQYILLKKIDDNDVFSPLFYKNVVKIFNEMRPFLDYMSSVLTTDENGIPLFEAH